MEKRRNFWETFIVGMIIIAVIQIFLEDLSRLGGWKLSFRSSLIVVGFLLDLIFTIEFIVRSILSKKQKGWLHYFKYQMGWIDLFSSIPPLLLNSGLIMLGMFVPGMIKIPLFLGMLNFLKITRMFRVIRTSRVVRITRVLRLLRVLKFSKKIYKNIERDVKNDYIAKVVSVTVLTIITVLIISSLFPMLYYNMENSVQVKRDKYLLILEDWHTSFNDLDTTRIDCINNRLKEDKDILFLYHMHKPVISNLEKEGNPGNIIAAKFFYTDYITVDFPQLKLYLSIRDVIIESAKINLLLETIIITLLIAQMIFLKDPSKT